MMKKLLRVVVVAVIAVFTLGVAGFGVFRYMNRTPPQLVEPNYYRKYLTQETVPEGRVGIFVSHLIQPEELRIEDFYVLAQKSLQYIPWPFRNIAGGDRGVVLMDTERFYEFEPFTPTRLVDYRGSETDLDGVPYVEKFHTGELVWSPPRPNFHLDAGYYILPSRKAGMPTSSAKLITKCRVYYYAAGKGFVNGRVPHESGNRIIAEESMQMVREKYGDIPWAWVTADHFGMARKAMYDLLDTGVDTVLIAPPRPVYSHHEEFNGSIKHAMHYIHEWEERNGKHIRAIITPQLGGFEAMRAAYLNMLKDRLDTFSPEDAVKVVISTHGMPWDNVPNEAWIQLAPAYTEPMMEEATRMLEGYGFVRHEVVLSQDHFADPYNNPNGTYLSTNKAFWDGIADGFSHIVNLPIEFFVENTDRAFGHAMFNFEYFDDFRIYEPIDYPDWNQPMVREFVQDGTRVIYNGTPVGRYRGPVVEAFFQAMDSILSQHEDNPAGDQPAQAAGPAFAVPFTGEATPAGSEGVPALQKSPPGLIRAPGAGLGAQ